MTQLWQITTRRLSGVVVVDAGRVTRSSPCFWGLVAISFETVWRWAKKRGYTIERVA